jgi:hypothetical protein
LHNLGKFNFYTSLYNPDTYADSFAHSHSNSNPYSHPDPHLS